VGRWSRGTPAAFVVGALGAAAIMLSPITPWPLAIAFLGLAVFVLAVAVLVTSALRNHDPWS
jgi:membrane protein implicated in regulation of membrane protease activity